MNPISKLALAAALTTGIPALVVMPAAIAKDKPAAKGKEGLQLSAPVRTAAVTAQTAINAKDWTATEAALAQVDAGVKTDDDKYVATALRYDYVKAKLYQQSQANPSAPLDETSLAAPLDALIALPNTPAADKARYQYQRGLLAFNGKQYPVAIQMLSAAKAGGYADSDGNLDLLIVKAKMESGDTTGGANALDSAITAMTAAGKKAPEEYYRYAIAKSNQKHDKATTIAWLDKYAAAYPTSKNWRDVVLTFGMAQNSVVTLDNNQKLDLYRLMRASKSLADEFDYEEYAQKALDKGLPWETQSVLREGMASGKIPAGSAAAKSLMTDATTSISREGSLAALERKAGAATNGQLAAQTADAYLGQQEWAKAIALYKTALGKGGVNADEVNTRLGIALSQSGDKAGAVAAFGAVKATPRADIAALWVTYLNTPIQAA